MSKLAVLEVVSSAHREVGLEGAWWCSQEVVQFPWSLCPVTGLGIGGREGGLGRKETSNSQASSVGPWLYVDADANVEPCEGAPCSTEAGALANPEAPCPGPWPSLSQGCSLLS